jgi:hypothetical protein
MGGRSGGGGRFRRISPRAAGRADAVRFLGGRNNRKLRARLRQSFLGTTSGRSNNPFIQRSPQAARAFRQGIFDIVGGGRLVVGSFPITFIFIGFNNWHTVQRLRK